MKENSKEINKNKQLLYIGIPIVLLFVSQAVFSTNYEAIRSIYIIIIALFGLLLFIITLFTNSQVVLKTIDLIKVIFITLCLFAIISTYFVLPAITDGSSMENTIDDKDILLCIYTENYKVGDIVIIYDKLIDENIVKRIIGVSNDDVYFEDNTYYLNGISVDEDYISFDNNLKNNDFILNDICRSNSYLLDCNSGIPTDYYLVLGDNRDISADSRTFGLFYKDDILAKVVFDVNKFKGL